ncbi:hypothetical protein AK812_SmicGene27215 [Symbiodinium microadriaticum]|uniref:Uncharacterized protein n=1 Tax=Symbiodinium microadriaticum TaxID=2951 RepID=A0A1Q9D7D9_SYMMI|nr:hypothetical protein AK812_SmicGene27215 [Symbiodinium microadriaticum]
MNPLRGSGVSERSRCGAVRILELAGEPSAGMGRVGSLAEAFGFEAEAPAAAKTRTHEELSTGAPLQAGNRQAARRIGGGGRGEAMGYAGYAIRQGLKKQMIFEPAFLRMLGGANVTRTLELRRRRAA